LGNELKCLSHQYDFLFSESKHTGLVAGYGAGKSFAGTLKTLHKKIQYPNVKVAYYLPTYPLIRDIAFDKFPSMCEELGMSYSLNKSNKELTIHGYGSILFRNMGEPENIVGYEVGYSLIDECDILPKEKMDMAFKKIVARNRTPLPDGRENQIDVVGTPEGFKWFYDRFVTNADRFTKLIRASTLRNKHLPPSYIDVLRETYPEALLSAYLNGEFVNLTSGTVYYVWDRVENNCDVVAEKGEHLHVGMDFNVNQMAAIVHVIRDGVAYAVDELLGIRDTPDMVLALQDRYPDHRITIYPDAAGQARQTNGSSQTDHIILRNAGFRINVASQNPRIKDRVASVNRALERDLYRVNVSRCPQLADGLEQQVYDKNGMPDKSTGHDHKLDAMGYYIFKQFPIHKPVVDIPISFAS